MRIKISCISLVEVLHVVCLGNVRELEEISESVRLFFYKVPIYADLLGDGVLGASIVEQRFFRGKLRLLIQFVEAEERHGEHGNEKLAEGAKPGALPIDQVFASQSPNVSKITTHCFLSFSDVYIYYLFVSTTPIVLSI